ncbi:PRC-barrel domain containing protein [Streptomyces lavendulocolor]|uniref:PRC-barrel domain containing protein n=1 Tax=Streptomyces lavendulocolor TaxID=67316 RepID=UPI0031D0CFE8
MAGNLWEYPSVVDRIDEAQLVGYDVEATDGRIGKVDEHTVEAGSAHLLVDTGPWILGRRVLLPAGTVTEIDLETFTVRVDRTRDEIKNAPEYRPDEHRGDPDYRRRIGGYYGGPAI